MCVCVFIEREGNGSINFQTMFENCTRLLGNRIILLIYYTFKKNRINETRTNGL